MKPTFAVYTQAPQNKMFKNLRLVNLYICQIFVH